MADGQQINSQMEVSINLDSTPILFTDNVVGSVNPDGLVLDVLQRIGSTNKMRIVSRVGMSKEHAKKLVEMLAGLIVKSEGRIETGKKRVVN